MEPFDIDKIIKNKLNESNDLHEKEIDSSKPFVWSAIQNQIGKKPSPLTWYHLAAAVVLLVVSFSFVLYSVQKKHKEEMYLLSNKIDEIQSNYLAQAGLINTKDAQVESLGNELENVELQLADLQQQKPLSQKETMVYRTDTVYVRQIEYITVAADSEESKEIPMASAVEQDETATTTEPLVETDDVIFPNRSNKSTTQTETLKFKIGPVLARKN